MRVLKYVLACAVMFFVSAEAATVEGLVERIGRNYETKQAEYNDMAGADRYRWEFVDVTGIPFGCRDDLNPSSCGEPVWVEGHGEIAMQRGPSVIVAVRSWIDRPDDRARVTRVFEYRREGGSWARVSIRKITENWDNDVGWVCMR